MKKYFGFSPNVFILSLISFLNDIGGETIKRTIPLFLSNVLQVPTTIIGLVEGVGEATPQLLQPFSGAWSDKLKKRKVFILGGQLLRSSMLLLVFVTSWPQVLLIRFLDRSGKGISSAPRDALISVSTPDREEGKAFGLNRALDNAGAVIGLVAAGFIIWFLSDTNLLSKETFTAIVYIAAIPLLIALLLIFKYVKDASVKLGQEIVLTDRLQPAFYKFLAVSFLFSLGNFSDGFLALKAQQAHIGLPMILFLLAQLALVSSVVSLPFGKLSDKRGRKKVLMAGWILFAVTYFGFAQTSSLLSFILLFSLYGLYYGMTEGVAKAYIADLVSPDRRGAAYGIYNLVVGLTLLPASLLAGYLWDFISPSAPFYFGSVLSFISVIGLWLLL